MLRGGGRGINPITLEVSTLSLAFGESVRVLYVVSLSGDEVSEKNLPTSDALQAMQH